MKQLDFVGGAMPSKQFLGQVRDTKDRVAEEKAILCRQLGELMNKPPQKVVNGSVQLTRRWVADRQKAEKVAKGLRSSVADLHGAIAMMRFYL